MKKIITSVLLLLSFTIACNANPKWEKDITADLQTTNEPIIKEAKLITASYIELDWAGTQYINNAGRSKENNTFEETGYFEVLLDGQACAQSFPWYWNITDYTLHGVKVNQNKTTIRLATALSTEQMKALENGTSKLSVRIANTNVTGNNSTPANTSTVYPVVYKPYYDKIIVSKTGIPVKASEFVNIRTLQKAVDMIDIILSSAPQAIIEKMRTTNVFCIFGPGEHSYNIPEHRGIFIRDAWTRAEGYGGFTAATSACNVERNGTFPAPYYPEGYRSGYAHECILAHEFGHGIHSAFNAVYEPDSPIRKEFSNAFSNLVAKNMWTPYVRNTASGGEYFATLTAVWYNAMAEGNSANCNTRDELYKFDRKGYDFFGKFFSHDNTFIDSNWSNCPNTDSPASAWDPEPFSDPVTRPIASAAPQATVTVPVGTAIDKVVLPTTVQVVFANNGGTGLPVSWNTSAYKSNVAGTYTMEGTIQATNVLTNPNNVKVSIKVEVK